MSGTRKPAAAGKRGAAKKNAGSRHAPKTTAQKSAARKTTAQKSAARKATARKRATGPRAAQASSPVLEVGLPLALGIRLLSIGRKKVVAEMPVTPMHLNRTGRVAGGAIMAFADALGAAGAVLNRLPGHRGGTVESKTNFFKPGTGPVLSAVSVPLHIGRTTSVWQTTVKNADGGLVAVVTQTQIALPRAAGNAEE